MSTTFWRDVRLFHKSLNLAHDGVLTSTELQVTFPKVLEGTFGLKTGGLSNQAYKEHLEAYLNRLYTAAYPDYFIRKLVRAQQQQNQSSSHQNLSSSQQSKDAKDLLANNMNPTETRNQLPLLLTHFEQDFISGLGKEEEAVLHIDLKHSLKALDGYYQSIDKNVDNNIARFFPIFVRGLTNTHYLSALPSASKDDDVVSLMMFGKMGEKKELPKEKVVNIIFYFNMNDISAVLESAEYTNGTDATYVIEQDEDNFDQLCHKYTYHVPITSIRLLFVAFAAFMYDSQKVTAMKRINQEKHQNNEQLQAFLTSVPNLLTPGVFIQPALTPLIDNTSTGGQLNLFQNMLSMQGDLGDVMQEIMQATGKSAPLSTQDPSISGSLEANTIEEESEVNDMNTNQKSNSSQGPKDLDQQNPLASFVKGLNPITSTNANTFNQGSLQTGVDSLHKMADEPMESDTLNIAWKYFIYSLSFQHHISHLVTNFHEVYNPLITHNNQTGYTQISEEDCNNLKKSEKERAVLAKIRQEQLILMEKNEQSKQIHLISSFSLTSLLNIIFRCCSSTLDISKSVLKMNDYIGEVTYGNEDEDEDQEMKALFEMMMTASSKPGTGGLMGSTQGSFGQPFAQPTSHAFPSLTTENPADDKSISSDTHELKDIPGSSTTTSTAPTATTALTAQFTANYEETMKLMNYQWLPPIRSSINWAQAFTVNQLVPTSGVSGPSSRQMMLMGKINQSTGNGPAMFNSAMQMNAEETMEERHQDFNLTDAMRARKYGGSGF